MIQGFRKLFQSRIGIVLALAFVGLIALAFASADITGGSFGGIGGGERVATVGDERISTSTYRETLNGAFQRAREENPQLTMEEFLAGGGQDGVLDQMEERLALLAFAQGNDLRIGDSLIGSELKDIPVFQGPDGKFDQNAYEMVLAQRGISEKLLRGDIEQGLAARLTLIPAQIGTQLPEKIAVQYAKLLNETRKGSVALIPSAAFVSDVKVDDAKLKEYLSANRARYSLPEKRTVQYAVITGDSLGTIEATDAEIAARYEDNKADYTGKELRTVTQLVLPTEPAAKAVLAEISTPSQLGSVASSKGLSTTQIADADRARLSSVASPAVTQAVFDTTEGQIAGPVRGPLGWYILRVDAATRTADRPIAEVREELAEAIVTQKRAQALADLASEAESELNSGASLAEVAKAVSSEVVTAGPFLSNGAPAGDGDGPNEIVQRVLPAVFAMDEGSDPQIGSSADGQSYIIFAPAKITRAAPPPFAQLKPALERDYRLAEGSKLAEAAANKVLAAVKSGKTPSEAMKLVGKPVPPVDQVETTRVALMNSGRSVPPALALMFSMAKGTTKKLEGPRNLGWMIVDLDTIETKDVGTDDPMVLATRRQLGPQLGGEFGEQLTRAIIADMGVSRNDTAIKAVVDQLTGNR